MELGLVSDTVYEYKHKHNHNIIIYNIMTSVGVMLIPSLLSMWYDHC